MAYNKKAHLRDNIEAIRLMFRLEKEQRTATPEEAGILAAYSGFGGIKAVLSPFGKLTDILRRTPPAKRERRKRSAQGASTNLKKNYNHATGR